MYIRGALLVTEGSWVSSWEEAPWPELPYQPLNRLIVHEGGFRGAWTAEEVGSGLLLLLECSSKGYFLPNVKDHWGRAAAFKAPRASAMSTPRERRIMKRALGLWEVDYFNLCNSRQLMRRRGYIHG